MIFMKFSPPLLQAQLRCRYKRFLADIRLLNGEITTIHCPNTGAMTHCLVEDSPCWYSIADNPKRKYPYTWEIATTIDGHLAGVNTIRANQLVREAIGDGVITELQGYASVSAEVKYGTENSRIDFLLKSPTKADCYVEVKSVTLSMGDGLGLFPDAVSQRGARHLRELMAMVEEGHRAVLLFCVQHTGITRVSPADDIDPVYGQTLRQAMASGVEVLAYAANISEDEIVLVNAIKVAV
jgi:sugar fermentation stimulation protein A